MEILEMQKKMQLIKENMEKVLVGKGEVITLVLTCLAAGGNVMLQDVPGTGKTMLAKSLAKSLNCDFKRIQFTPDLLPSDVTGIHFFNQKEQEFTFRPGPVFTNILLGDEMNRATPRTQSSLLECMEEKQVTVDGITMKLASPFLVLATQNPVETTGTFPLPEAQMDRFFMELAVGFPDFQAELAMLERFGRSNPLDTLLPVADGKEILDMQETAKGVFVHPLIQTYLLKIVEGTREHGQILLGVSPRGSLAFLQAAKAYAAIMGRDYVALEDVKYLAPYVLGHRMVLRTSYEEKITGQEIVRQIAESVPAPTEDFRFAERQRNEGE